MSRSITGCLVTQNIGEEFKIFEATLLNLFPCAAQRYRGSAHRARGLVLQKNPMCFFFNPSLRRCRSSVSPLYCCAIQGRRGEYSQRTEKIKRPFKATHLILSLCIATIDIGGSARRAKGLKQNLQESQSVSYTHLTLPTKRIV